MIVAADQKTAKVYSGKMPEGEFLPEPELEMDEAEPVMTETDRTMLVNSTFNLDLVHDLGLPIANAVYSVYATLGQYKSNVLTIRTKVE